MVSGGPRLGQVEPRERAGAQTGRKYEYQYERAARAALDLLADTPKRVCVYCDWHDDYVVEVGDPPTRYVFHQVKGRKSSQGPWTFSEFFGVLMKKAKKPSKNPATVKLDAVVPRMVLLVDMPWISRPRRLQPASCLPRWRAPGAPRLVL